MNILEIMVNQLAAGSPPLVPPLMRERHVEETEAQATADGRTDGEDGAGQEERQDLREAADSVAKALKDWAVSTDVDLKFNVVEPSGTIQVEVRDAQSGKVIRKIPEDEILRLAEQMRAMSGVMIDDLV